MEIKKRVQELTDLLNEANYQYYVLDAPEISAKNVGSVAAQFGMKDVFTETFGVSGYSTTPKQLKAIADKNCFEITVLKYKSIVT